VDSASLHFNLHVLLTKERVTKREIDFAKKQVIFSHGDRNDSLFYIEKGIVKLTVTSREGREAIIGLFDAGHFFGESCISGDQPVRFHNAVALTDVRLVRIDRRIMVRILMAGGDPVHSFVSYLLRRSAQTQEDLAYNLLSSSEDRLARVLILLTQSAEKGEYIPKLTQQTLAEIIGTTRQRVNILMKRFRELHLVGDARASSISRSSPRDIALGSFKAAHSKQSDAAKGTR
jgi:CRP/FNR family transcriptional regulator, cyclic AMP receptor protein